MTRRVLLSAIVVLVLASVSSAQEPPPPAPTWQISHVRGGLYRVNAGPQVTVFYVTGDGIVLVDPLSAAVSAWLKRELAIRFPEQAVRYVVYTHHHFDRASGGAAFDKTAVHVAHESFFEERIRSSATLPATLAALDRNRDGRLDQDEVSGTAFESPFAVYDRNEDRRVTPGELYSFVRAPEAPTAHAAR
jgi:glyoxylase-like metal-dependent hydrolase (beta-lactamase superfamily II)